MKKIKKLQKEQKNKLMILLKKRCGEDVRLNFVYALCYLQNFNCLVLKRKDVLPTETFERFIYNEYIPYMIDNNLEKFDFEEICRFFLKKKFPYYDFEKVSNYMINVGNYYYERNKINKYFKNIKEYLENIINNEIKNNSFKTIYDFVKNN